MFLGRMFSSSTLQRLQRHCLKGNLRSTGDRPRMTMLNELVGLSWHFGFMPQGNTWKTHRRIFANDFNSASVSQFRPHQLKWRDIFLGNLLKTPNDFETHIQHLASGLSLDMVFGLDVQPSGKPDPFIHAATQAVEGLAAAGLFGTYVVDYLPLLKHLPFAQFQRQAKAWKTSVDIAVTVPFNIVKTNMAEGKDVQPSIASSLIEAAAFAEADIQKTTSSTFANGSAAVVSALRTFVLAMSLNPGIQSKAQNEIDAVLLNAGKSLPDFGDEASCPWITAIVKEVLRWNPVVPLAFPHKLTADDVYNGYHLPAGSVILPNAWAMLHNAKVYGEDVSSFRPERFLTKEGKLDPSIKSPDVAFGFGRRVCPARNLVLSELFIFIASTLAMFEISSIEGTNRETAPGYTSGLLRYPVRFSCKIRSRSPRHENIVEALAQRNEPN
ncbi:cytochrome P450 [Gymnopus androsaceus JB14]|uniref:Cytochrome P450 n=1 Tax=Gymnopus androsaceus JB14 TaxID=1447944 RepID=A0A6A4IE86_9AGAR|nr:cytochrome P450 [Gymnopus androsaceus JB14]